MKLTFSTEDELFRSEVAEWLNDNLTGEFERIRWRGGPGDEHMFVAERKAWERRLHQGGWTCIGWPVEYGGRGASIEQQVIFNEEYARAGGPGRTGHIGETLTGPTLIAFGSEQQKERYLPGIREGKEFWCQGYSEPSAGSDLANVKTRAVFDDGLSQWKITGQKVWTSLAQDSEYCFVIARTDPSAKGHKGLGFFLVKLNQPGVDIRPITQMTGTSEFNEIFFDDAVCEATDLVGEPGDGWKVAMGLLGYERGVSTLGQQMLFQNELDEIIALAKRNDAAKDPIIRHRIADAHMGLRIMRFNSMRMLSGGGDDGSLEKPAMIYKLYWATWHRNLGKLAMDVMGARAVTISDIHEKRLEQAVENLREETGLESIFGHLANVTQEDQVQDLVDKSDEAMQGVDVLINNAGLGGTCALIDMSDEEWSNVLDITLTGTMRMTRCMLKKMKLQGGGVIVNNASVLGWRAQKEQCHYAAAKAGVMALTRCVALEAADYGVRVNAVSPSIAFHGFLKKTTPSDLLDELASKEAYGRAAEVWEVANVMMFLASDYSSYMTGEIVSVSSQRA